ncbi:hypothetical protein [Halobacillus trueperi]|uniref:Uncharacterized protein n=1 Tax=Halobacillus trueperi TaxID=156205 RepID=A0A3E0J279_9BACI|nr:hypothetical protein [Halobacillus trueperi]REJ06927.1 hypothetical protein DYE48_17490 [Halobacillus trueperi]
MRKLTQDQFIEEFVIHGLEEKYAKLTERLFNFMSEEDGADFIDLYFVEGVGHIGSSEDGEYIYVTERGNGHD